MNILPTNAARWSGSGYTFSNLSFTFEAGGYARCIITPDDVASLDVITLSAGTSFASDVNNQAVVCRIVFHYAVSNNITYTCFLLVNTNNLYRLLLEPGIQEFTSIEVELSSAAAGNVVQLTMDLIVASYDEIIQQLQDALPRLIEDYNIYDFTVAAQEQTIALINAYMINDTVAEGHISFNYVASESGILTVRIYDTMHKELYVPIEIEITAGKHLFAMPHAYLKRLKGPHTFYVTAQVSAGIISIDTRKLLYTIDSAYMLQHLADIGLIVSDLTAKTVLGQIDPTDVYTISVANNTALVQYTPYNRENIFEWKADFVVADLAVIDAAIEFNANWQVLSGHRYFVTEDTPWIFLIAADGTLYGQRGNNSATRISLATDVVKVAALRAWLYENSTVDNDLGLIVAYIKTDGKVYYRQYRIPLGGSLAWTAEELITFTFAQEPIQELSLLRLNDYRVAIVVEDSLTQSYALISQRYYQADSVKPIYVKMGALGYLNLAEPIYPEIVAVYNVSNTETIVELNMPLNNIQLSVTHFSLRDSTSKVYTITAIAFYEEDHSKLILTNATYMNSINPFTFIYTNDTAIYASETVLFAENQGSRFYVPTKTIIFNAEDFTPKIDVFNKPEYVKLGVSGEISLSWIAYPNVYATEKVKMSAIPEIILRPVAYLSYYNAPETVSLSVLGLIVVTKVGDQPI